MYPSLISAAQHRELFCKGDTAVEKTTLTLWDLIELLCAFNSSYVIVSSSMYMMLPESQEQSYVMEYISVFQTLVWFATLSTCCSPYCVRYMNITFAHADCGWMAAISGDCGS